MTVFDFGSDRCHKVNTLTSGCGKKIGRIRRLEREAIPSKSWSQSENTHRGKRGMAQHIFDFLLLFLDRLSTRKHESDFKAVSFDSYN